MNLNLKTYNKDGRKPILELYNSFISLTNRYWVKEDVFVSRAEDNRELSFPIISLRTPKKGDAIWLLSGIHGEEPAGPNAIAKGIGYIAKLGEEMPVVLLPLCNPLGYARNWRYLNMPGWIEGIDGKSVGASEHLLLSRDGTKRAISSKVSNTEADALTSYVVKLSREYKPILTIDLHEDILLDEGGYVYVNAENGYNNKIAKEIIRILSKKIQIKYDGLTRFGEKILKGVIAEKNDSIDEVLSASIDDLFFAKKIILNDEIVKGPSSKTSIVVETPANLPLEKRMEAHLEIIKNLKELVKTEC